MFNSLFVIGSFILKLVGFTLCMCC